MRRSVARALGAPCEVCSHERAGPSHPDRSGSMLVLLLAPLLAGMFGTTFSSIPERSFRPVAFAIAVVVVACIAAMMWSSRPSASAVVEVRMAAAVKLTLALVMFMYFFYVCFHVIVPAWITRAAGATESREYEVDSIRKTGRGWSCPYRMTLRDIVFVMDDSFCVSEDFARQHPVGAQIRVDGERSTLALQLSFDEAADGTAVRRIELATRVASSRAQSSSGATGENPNRARSARRSASQRVDSRRPDGNPSDRSSTPVLIAAAASRRLHALLMTPD